MFDFEMQINLTEKQKQYKVFKYYLESIYKTKLPIVSENFIDSCCYEKYFLSIKQKALYASERHLELIKNKEQYAEVFQESYNKILDKWIDLILELKLNNSLDIINAFTYLLWNGYFSSPIKTNVSDKKIIGWEALEVIANNKDAISVNVLLKDLLTRLCIDSAVIYNSLNGVVSNKEAEKVIFNNNEKKCQIKLNNSPNSAGILIIENDKLYIYDPINLVCAKVNEPDLATVIDGKGIFKLKPFLSYAIINSKNEFKTLDELFNKTVYSEPDYSKLIDTSWNNIYHILMDNKFLIKDCYNETILNINKINDNLVSVKKRIRKK